MTSSLVVKITCGAEAAERANQAWTVAAMGLAAGAEVMVWLTGEAVWFAVAAGFLAVPVAVPVVFFTASPGFLLEGKGVAWIGFFEPMAERAGFVAVPVVSFAAEVAPPAAGVFLTGVLLAVDFAAPVVPAVALAGAFFTGVAVPLFAGVLPVVALFPSFEGAFLAAGLGSLSTILILLTPSADAC